jgi:GNAT superfamily N-acetyltransferase
MNDFVLKNASEEQLNLAVEENLFALFRAMATLPGSQIEEGEYLSRHLAPPTNPMYKGVWNTHLSTENADEKILETVAWFKSQEAPFFFWWTGPQTQPDDIGFKLTKHGLVDMEGQGQAITPGIKSTAIGAPGMVADLHRMNEAMLEKVPQAFEINDVQNETDLQDFKQVFIDGYEMPATMAEGWVQSAREFGIGKTPWRLVLGRLNGQPVATNIIVNGGGVSGVFGIAVVPSARGKGIGTAITLRPLLEARDREGYHYAVLFSSEMGTPVYERIGFRMTPTRINRYLWRNS